MSVERVKPVVEALELGVLQLPDWHPRHDDVTCLIRGFVIRHPDGLVLVDTGVGDGHPLIEELYQPTVVSIVEALHAAEVDERDITAIVNTHLHFDHCGQNRLLPSVPVFVQSAELVAAQAPRFTIPEWAHIELGRRRVIDGDEEIAPGVRILATPGHTPGHQAVLVTDRDGVSQLVAGQCCYTCAEFVTGEIDPADFDDLAAGVQSLARLRNLDIVAAHFSHDQTIYRPSTRTR